MNYTDRYDNGFKQIFKILHDGEQFNSGIIDTPFQDRISPSAEAKYAFAATMVPGRARSSEGIAKVVAFLASSWPRTTPRSSQVTAC
ncbi:hypothetical protein [Microvirga yunnanensis]|uniref:hypothetical protein n=1 Tax=Microvirga yunnanensis TaxID=2953740 RepID=UPI0021C6A78D|nr:hypothetical protein [Microvirga sp. HBU65207]